MVQPREGLDLSPRPMAKISSFTSSEIKMDGYKTSTKASVCPLRLPRVRTAKLQASDVHKL